MSFPYILDPVSKVWMRTGSNTLPYSDGDEVELRLLSILKSASDISVVSAELSRAIVDWPSEYHFSSARHNLLRPFGIGPEHKVLELGCGCGAMTRYLGETGATVIAVEGSRRRAEIATLRCRDLQNVTVYCDNLIDFTSTVKFDFVTLIGVLEYAPKFIPTDDSVSSCLLHARTFLQDDGALIIAIENQLGLKYFNGCNEDHVGIPYYSINSLYGSTDPVTYGRQVLSEKLAMTGFPAQDFFYPFPDYKVPKLILSEHALHDSRLNVADLLIHNAGRNYPETRHRAFAEDLAWRAAVRNRLLPDLANSFLVFAKKYEDNRRSVDWLTKMYSQDRRRPCYQVESTIVPGEANNLIVRKQKLFPSAPLPEGPWLRHIVAESHYLPGNLLVGKIREAMAREDSIENLAASFLPWVKFLLAHATENEAGETVLPAHFVDCLPANLIQTTTGELRYFDAEWVSDGPIPLAWVIVRGIFNALRDCLENRHLAGLSYRQLIVLIAQSANIRISETEYAVAFRCEEKLVHCCIDGSSNATYAEILDKPVTSVFRLSRGVPEHNAKFIQLSNELARVKGSVSWRVTSPLRVFWNLLRKLSLIVKGSWIR